MNQVIHLASFAAVLSAVQGWPSGAPKSSCESMLPGHGEYEAQEESKSPYTLAINANEGGKWSISVS